MLTNEQVQQFHEDGFLNGGPALNDEQVAELQDELGRVIAERDNADVSQPVSISNLGGNPETPVWQIVNIWQASKAFHSLIFEPALVDGIAQLTGARELRVWHDQIQYKPAERGGVNMWHQDHPYWPILTPAKQVTAWVALDDVDESNGCMSMVRGSHQWGNSINFLHSLSGFDAMPRARDGHRLEVMRRPVRKGNVHFHHALTWHGSHANLSGRPRRAIAVHFMPDETRYVASGHHLMKQFVTVADGDKLEGEAFPLVWHARG